MEKKIIVIKFGGEIVDSPEQLNNLAYSVNELYKQHHKIILVHGGGPYASKLSERMNLKPHFVGGRRVTCHDTLEVMKMTLPGVINSNVLAILKKFGLPGVSVSGISFIEAVKRPPKKVTGSHNELIDFGYVGDVVNIQTDLIEKLLDHRLIPVISPLAADDGGQILNINADTIAVKTAQKLKASKLVLITKIGGVYQNIEDKSSKFQTLTMEQAKQKIKDGVIQGGMIPKLEESFILLEEQLDSFHIVGTDNPICVLEEIRCPGSRGTAVIRNS